MKTFWKAFAMGCARVAHGAASVAVWMSDHQAVVQSVATIAKVSPQVSAAVAVGLQVTAAIEADRAGQGISGP